MRSSRKFRVLIGSLLTIICLVSCVSEPTKTIEIELTDTAPAKPSLTSSPTYTLTPISPTITFTLEPTFTPSYIPTESPRTRTPTVGPTMTSIERKRHIQELLQTDASCDLPCWWGIIPGKTHWRETEEFLRALGARIGSQPDENGSIFHGTGGFDFEGDQLYNRLGFIENKGIVEYVYISSEGYANVREFQRLWKRYSPKNVISEYGPPSRVWIKSTSSYRGNTGYNGYQLWLFYDEAGFVVKYSGGVIYQFVYHFCPSMDNENDIDVIELLLQSPDSSLPLDRIDVQDELFLKYIRNLEDVAGISMEQFYRLFTEGDKSGCFGIPSEAFHP